MKRTLTLALVSFSLLCLSREDTLHAQGYMATAQITSQAAGDGTYNYSIVVNNSSSSTLSLNTFWFAWLPAGNDLLASSPTIIDQPDGWYGYTVNNSYYGPDGYSLDFYNYYGSAIDPGTSATFSFNSPDAPATLMGNSTYADPGTPVMTSYVYDQDYPDGDGFGFQVSFAPVPEPSSIALLGVSAVGLLYLARRSQKI